MKKKLICWILTFVLVMSYAPAALAADADEDGYNDNDFLKLQTFLNQPSATAGKTNGQALNPGYDPGNPTTWTGVTWSEVGEKCVTGISFGSYEVARGLAGTLDVSGCTALQGISCTNNALTSVIVTGATEMTYFYCGMNSLTTLDVTGLTKLKYLECEENALTTLDVSGLTALDSLWCFGNTLTELNVSGCTALDLIDCCDNALTTLDVSGCTVLTRLSCGSNELTDLDESTLTSLTMLNCSDNPLTSLDVSGLTSLTVLDCSDTGRTSLNVSPLTNLHYFYCSGNALTTLDVSALTGLDEFDCSDNALTALDVSALINMVEFDCSGNALTTLSAKLTRPLDGASEPDLQPEQLTPINDTASDEDPYINTLGNPLTQTTVNIDGKVIRLAASNGGYVQIDGDNYEFIAKPKASSRFVNWTAADGSQAAATETVAFNYDTDYNLKANFEPAVIPVPVGLSCSKTDATTYNGSDGSVTITASGGNSGSYEYSLDGGTSWQASNVFGGLAANTYTAAVRDAAFPSNIATQAVTVGQPAYMGTVPAKKIASKANAGTAVTILPPAAPKGYTTQSTTFSSSNPAVATVDANGNVSFLAGGKVTIITKVISQTVDKKGTVKTKTTTVKKTITVKQPVASISLSAADATIARKTKLKLTATIAPGTASNKKLTWKSSNPKVAAVSGSGVVTGKAGGTAVITCTAKDGSGVVAGCTVTVTPIYPTAIKLSKAALTVKLGKTASLKATVSPKNTDFKTVTWASSNPAVAMVDAKGKVKGIAAGTAVITAITSSGQIASCTVTVQ